MGSAQAVWFPVLRRPPGGLRNEKVLTRIGYPAEYPGASCSPVSGEARITVGNAGAHP